jgi:hypothetical protein
LSTLPGNHREQHLKKKSAIFVTGGKASQIAAKAYKTWGV